MKLSTRLSIVVLMVVALCLVMAACGRKEDINVDREKKSSWFEDTTSADKPGRAKWTSIVRTEPDEYGVVCYHIQSTSSVSCVKVK